ncbi:MAG: DUF3857 domain-containing protein [Acidobacteriota bacterium]
MRIAAVLAFVLPVAALAGDWPQIPDAERKLASVAGFPEAPAVVLFRQGHLELSGKTLSSYLDVYTRVKVLKPEGKPHGTVTLFSSDFYRMKDLEARVHLPDGKVVDLPPDAKFEKKFDAKYDRAIVAFALPEVAPGAIVEYRYRVYFDSVLFPEPWYFQDVIPVAHSEVSCTIPKSFVFKPEVVKTITGEIKQDVAGSATGVTSTLVAGDVPPVPDEPGAPPFADLATRVTFLPVAANAGGKVPLLESWGSLVHMIQGDRTAGYEYARKHAMTATLRGKKIANEAGGGLAGARAIYAFVRDQVTTQPFLSVANRQRQGDDILSKGAGDDLEKALLLQIMLDGAGIESSLGWTLPRELGEIETSIVNPAQFGAVILEATIDGKSTLLYPGDPSLAFGTLPPGLEGVPCLLVDRKEPEWIETPQTPAVDSARIARLDLAVAPDGVVSGTGTLTLTGNHGWERLRWKDTAELTRDAWQKWLAGKLAGFDVREVAVDEDVEARRVSVTFSIAQRPDEVVDREASVPVAAPFAQTRNPFTLPPSERRTPVVVTFPDSEQLEIVVRVPPGWKIASRPKLRSVDGRVGKLETKLDEDAAASRIVLTRRLDVLATRIGRDAYPDLVALFRETVASDAEVLVLAPR